MLLPKNLVKKLNENGITVTPAVRTERHIYNFVDDSYFFTKKSPLGREWKVEIGSGCPNWEHFVSDVANYYLNFSSENEAIELYNAQKGKEGEHWSLQQLLDDMNDCFDGFVLLLSDLFSEYEYTKQDAYENLAYTAKILFEGAVCDTTASPKYKNKDLVAAFLNRKTFFSNCEGVPSLFTTYLATEKIVDFLNGEKLTDEQKAFIVTLENPIDTLVDATKFGWEHLMSLFFDEVIPDTLNMLMNSQSEESAGDNNG